MIFITTIVFLIICSVSISSDPNIYSNLEDKRSVEKTGKGEQDYKTQPTNQKKKTKKTHTTHMEKMTHNPNLQLWEFFLWVLLAALPTDTVPFQVLQIREI